MENFQNYFYNAKKLYEFRIKVANVDITNKAIMEAIKNALDAYEVETISAPKRLPIQEHRDFGKLGACEVHVLDVALCYPTIAEQVRQLIINRALVPNECICVYTKDQALNEELVDQKIVMQGANGPIIENPELAEDPGGQEMAGQKRIDSLLKELSKQPSLSKAYTVAGNDNTDGAPGGKEVVTTGKTTNDLPMGTKAPVRKYRETKGL